MKQISRRMMRFPANKNPVCQLNRRKKITECSISSFFNFFVCFYLSFYFSFTFTFLSPIGNCYIVHYRILFHRLNVELTKYCSFIYLHTFYIHSHNPPLCFALILSMGFSVVPSQVSTAS